MKLQSDYRQDEQIQNADFSFNILDAHKSVRLVERPLEGSEKRLTFGVKLVPLADSVK